MQTGYRLMILIILNVNTFSRFAATVNIFFAIKIIIRTRETAKKEPEEQTIKIGR